MGFPSPAADFVESRPSLDGICNTRAPSVYIFKCDADFLSAGIKKGALLVINSDKKPTDGSVIAVHLKGTFRLVRYRTDPILHLAELSNPERRLPMTEEEMSDSSDGIFFGVITHVLNDMRMTEH